MNNEVVSKLRSAVLEHNEPEILSVLNSIDFHKKQAAKFLSAIHEALLFCIAYAPSEKIYLLATSKLSQLNAEQDESGINGGTVISSYTLSITKWMMETFSGCISFHSFDEDKSDVGELLKLILPTAEAEILTNGWSKTKLFRELCGGKITIEKIIALFHDDKDEKLNEYVFSQLKIYVQLGFDGNIISRTTAQSVSYPPFYNQDILEKPDTDKLISTPLNKTQKITAEEKISLASNARMQLAAMGRETDPVTFSCDEETEFFVLDRGFSIALFSLKKENRLAFDSYIGYLMFKNGRPVAYGGAWIFFHRALIGINIFDAYRGGESSFLFAQLLRVYHQRYEVNRFSVEPYQYGKDNPEGIASGAYWFYYRFGFRSDDEKLKSLAAEEDQKIKNEKGYRTSSETLKKFTHSNITHFLAEGDKSPDPAKLSLGISEMIAKKFNGDRHKTLAVARKNFELVIGKGAFSAKTKTEKTVFENWSMALLYFAKTKFSAAEKKNFISALKEKSSGKESAYIHYLQKIKFS